MDDFTGISPAGNSDASQANWTATISAPIPQTFVPFPASGQPPTDEVGYGEGGYGAGGYDTPGVAAISAPVVSWTPVSSK